MAIQVICHGCHAKFQVSDKFAGKKGPCPKCKAEITVPEKNEEVVIHAPEEFGSGGQDAQGRMVLKPIARKQTKISAIFVGTIVAVCIVVFIVAALLGNSFQGEIPFFLLALGAVGFAPPLTYAGYSFLRDDELEPYRGRALAIRVAICSLIYALLWFLFKAAIAMFLLDSQPELWHLLLFIPPIVLIAIVTTFACFDFDFTSGFIHYGLYLLVTVLLRLTMGMAPY